MNKGNLRTTLSTFGDAVIVTDTKGYIAYISPIALELTDREYSQALGESITTVFDIIHSHTRKPVDSLAIKVLETGLIVGLSNITILSANDDREYQISDLGAPICDRQGNFSGVVLIFRDITKGHTLYDELKSSQNFIKALLNTVPDQIWLKDKKGVYLACNAKFQRRFGAKENEIIGKTDYDFVDEKLASFFQKSDRKVLISGKTIANEDSITFADDGHVELVETIKTPMKDDKGNLIGILGVSRDITNYRESLAKLKESESRLKEAQVYAKIGFWELMVDQQTTFWSDQMYVLLGLPESSKPGPETLYDVINKKDFRAFTQSIKKSFATGKEHHVEYRIVRPSDGEKRWIECKGKILKDIDGNAHKISGFIQDITDRKNTYDKLQLSSRVFSDTHEGIIITNSEKVMIDVNPAFSHITGYSREEAIGKKPSILSSGQQGPEFYKSMWLAIKEQGYWQGEVWNRTKQGEMYAELLTISSLTNDDNVVTNYVGVFTDITNSKLHQEQLNLMAHYDVLTKLPNRALFVDRFNQSIAHSKRTGQQLAVCFIDLDNFKPINDIFGHETGDNMLIEVANRIIACVRAEDTVSRQGGDEFAILLNDIKTPSQHEETMKRIHYAVALPYIINEVEHNITASSGVTLYPSDDGDVDTLLRHADQAMYQAKLSGKNCSQLYSPDSDHRIIEKNHQLEEITQALINHEFKLYYQPKVNMSKGNVFGVEALIRWIHPEKGLIAPLDFLPLIDGTSLEVSIGQWVLKEALSQLDNWQQQDIKLEMSVNVSSNYLLSHDFFEVLQEYLTNHPAINPKNLQLEILESSALGDLKTITQIIETCQNRLGVTFSLDDFGTGYSSLTHLRSLPASTIKIDQSFVYDMLDDPDDYSIIEGVIAMTKSFNRNVIAEGVETTNHGLMLLLMGCEQAQGYAIAKPMPSDVFVKWLFDYIPNERWLQCANKQLNNKENSIEIFIMISELWKEKFLRKILSPLGEDIIWPIMDSGYCQCGNWIRRKKQDQLFKKESIEWLEQSHEKMHVMADDIKIQYQEGDIDSARAALVTFDLAFDEMIHAVGLCE